MMQYEGLPIAFLGLSLISIASFCLIDRGRIAGGMVCSATGAGFVLAGLMVMCVG